MVDVSQTDSNELLDSGIISDDSANINKDQINSLIKDVRDTKGALYRHKYKKTGIEPGKLTNLDVKYYFDLV